MLIINAPIKAVSVHLYVSKCSILPLLTWIAYPHVLLPLLSSKDPFEMISLYFEPAVCDVDKQNFDVNPLRDNYFLFNA